MADNITVTPGTGKTVLADEVTEGTLGTGIAQVIKIMDATIGGTNLLAVSAAGAAKVDGSAVTQPVSGTFFQATQPVSAASLPLPTGAATAAKQPALGTAGTASADVITVQGKAAMTPVLTDGSATTQPVSGTVTTTPPSNASTNVAQLAGTATDTNSGNKSAGTLRVVLATDQPSMSNAQPASQSGTWTVQPGNTANTTPWLTTNTPATSGGLSISRTLSANNTTGINAKGSAGQVFGWAITNTNASVRFVKLYNKATAPTVGTDVPVITLAIPGNANGAGMIAAEYVNGIAFGTGVGYGITTLVADNDTTAPAANEVIVNLFYK